MGGEGIYYRIPTLLVMVIIVFIGVLSIILIQQMIDLVSQLALEITLR